MDWLKQNYDKTLLGLFALVLLFSGILIILNCISFPEQFAKRNSSNPPNNIIPSLPVDQVRNAAKLVAAPSSWRSHDGSVFVSRPYVLKDGNLVDPLEGRDNLHAPISNAWLIRYNLEYWLGNIKDLDPDEDHFSNLEEFMADTDPRDKRSIPAYYTKLRLKEYDPVPFLLTFQGTPDDGESFQINIKASNNRRGRTQFLKLGDMIEGHPYKVLSYKKASADKDGIEIDVSELTVENTETGKKIVLFANKEANDPTSYGKFLYLYDNSEMRLKKDDEFTLAPETDRKYKLIDISGQEALIQDVKSGEKYTIPRLDQP